MSETPQQSAIVGAGKGGIVPPVEHRFKAGNRANPGGLPKGTRLVKKRLRNAVLRYAKEHPELIPEIAAALAEEARTRPKTVIEREGNTVTTTVEGQCWGVAQKLIWDRVDGPLTQRQEIEHKGSVQIVSRRVDTPARVEARVIEHRNGNGHAAS